MQARGSGTEAVMLLMAKNHGITLGNDQLCAGLGGPPQRASPGNDQGLDRRRGQPARAGGGSPRQVHRAAGRGSRAPPTKGLFATADYLKNNAADVDILVEELIKTGREITDNPAVAVEFRNKYKLLPDLGAEADAEIAEYYKETAEAGSLALNGGGAEAAADDFAFFSLAGQIEGDPATLKVEDFWDVARARPRASPSSARNRRQADGDSLRTEGEAVGLAPLSRAWQATGRLLDRPIVLRLHLGRAVRRDLGGRRAASRSVSPFRPSPTRSSRSSG